MKKRIVPFTETPQWPILAELTDKTVLGTDGLSNAAPRTTARAVLVRDDGLYGVMYATKFQLYSLPGGGMEDGESPEEAVIREIFEETGCTCHTVNPLGVILENRFHADYTQINYYFVAHVGKANHAPHLTSNEVSNGTHVQWHPLEEVRHLITDCTHDTNQRKFLQARDVVALKVYTEFHI